MPRSPPVTSPSPISPQTTGNASPNSSTKYADMDLGTVDAAVIAIAERLNIVTLATINTRDFRVVRPAHCDAFELVP